MLCHLPPKMIRHCLMDISSYCTVVMTNQSKWMSINLKLDITVQLGRLLVVVVFGTEGWLTNPNEVVVVVEVKAIVVVIADLVLVEEQMLYIVAVVVKVVAVVWLTNPNGTKWASSECVYVGEFFNLHKRVTQYTPSEMKMCTHQSEGSPMTKIQIQCEQSVRRPQVAKLWNKVYFTS